VWHPQDPATGSTQSPLYGGGSIDRVDIGTGRIERLYTSCDGVGLRGPNDLVFDTAGGFWFTDFGKSRPGEIDIGAVYYALADGSSVTRVVTGLIMANGIGLSPDDRVLYVAETRTGRLWAFDLDGPGQLAAGTRRLIEGHTGRCILNTLGYFDSLAVQANGDVVVAALSDGLCVVSPDGSTHSFVPLDDPIVTNVCFGGADRRTAYVTLSATGRLVALDWPEPGLPLAY
jgi:gluconolactonase